MSHPSGRSCSTMWYSRFSGAATTTSKPSSGRRKNGYIVSRTSVASPMTSKTRGMLSDDHSKRHDGQGPFTRECLHQPQDLQVLFQLRGNTPQELPHGRISRPCVGVGVERTQQRFEGTGGLRQHKSLELLIRADTGLLFGVRD